MSPPGRPQGENRKEQPEGSPMSGRWQRPALLDNLRRAPDRGLALQRYARLASDYEHSTRRVHEVRRRAIAELALQAGETVWDVACGAGAMLPELARQVGPQGRALGIEQSPAMAALARQAIAGIDQAGIHLGPVEEFSAVPPADALIFMYAHDVLQNPAALAHVLAQARPGARLVVAGLCLLPWWGLAVNAWVLWRARHYLTTWHGLRQPWQPLQAWCAELRIVQRFHGGTSYLAVGRLDPPTPMSGMRGPV